MRARGGARDDARQHTHRDVADATTTGVTVTVRHLSGKGGARSVARAEGQSMHVSAPPHHRSAHDERNTPRGATTAHRVASVRRLVLHHLRHDRSDARQCVRESKHGTPSAPSRSTPLHSPATAHARAACDPRDARKGSKRTGTTFPSLIGEQRMLCNYALTLP